jgi:quercetin dioxygenase-like cupin family protein
MVRARLEAVAVLLIGGTALTYAQAPGGGPQTWWISKTQGGVYKPPMKPIWKLSELKKKYAGTNNWKEQIVLDPEQDATYNSAAPGTKFPRQMHPDSHNIFVVTGGELRFTIEGQQPVVATRGSIVNILKSTIFSYEAAGTQNALWVDVNPPNYKTVYPSDDPQPAAAQGATVVKVSFNHTPAAYTSPNQAHWNLFDAASKCEPLGTRVIEDGQYANAIYGFADANDPLNKCGGAARGGAAPAGGRGGRGGAPAAFNPNSTFGHLHLGPAEWWIVQVGHIRGQFENTGEFVAEEGDVLYAPPMTWHQMGFVGAGPSCRLALGGYQLINMNNTGGQ